MPNLTRDYLGIQKRKELTSLVRKASKKRDLLRLRVNWDTELHDGRLSCCNVVLGKEGNVFSLYTWTKRRRVENLPLPRFNSVEVALFDERYEQLATQVCDRLSRKGYEAEMTKTKYYTSRAVPHEVYRD